MLSDHADMSPRAIVYCDVDCFYAQVEELRDPRLRGRPICVTQKFLVVTANYAARALGVQKLQQIHRAKAAAGARARELVFVDGSDLTPYRAASDGCLDALRKIDAKMKEACGRADAV